MLFSVSPILSKADVEQALLFGALDFRKFGDNPFDSRQAKTFIDLGSNVGYFTCYAADRIGRDAVRLAVDVNLKMAEETKWHIEHNGWPRVKGLWSVVGYPLDVEKGTFYLNPSNIAGSLWWSFEGSLLGVSVDFPSS